MRSRRETGAARHAAELTEPLKSGGETSGASVEEENGGEIGIWVEGGLMQ